MAVKAQFIAGQWLPGSGATMSKLAPEDQSLLWQAASAGADDVQAACAAARAAFYPWSHRPLAERIDVVQRFAALLETHKEALATLISRETSKPLWETRTEVQAMIGKAAISIEAYHQRTGFHESTLPDGKALLRHKPHGVMAVFGPYNFPGHLPNGHIIPALIAGNTIVFKPSELTPATAEMTVQLWQQAGIPDGAINLLQGGKATGQALLENRDIDGVLFTGSAAAGFHFHRYFGGQPEKMLALEMGGNNALIVADVADIDAALHVIIQSAFISAGQRCTCARRLIVPRGEQGDALLQRLVEASAQIRAGKWDDQPAPFMGGVISLDAAQNMLAAQQKLEGLGGKVLLRMRQPDGSLLPASQVIPAAELAGGIAQIDHWVLEHALFVLAERQAQGPSLRLFVSQSPRSLARESHAQWLLDALRARGIEGTSLVIDLRLADALIHTVTLRQFCQQLMPAGVQFCLSQFEPGAEADALLTQLPLGFVRVSSKYASAHADMQLRDQLRGIIDNAHRQGLQVIGQQIEDPQAAAAMWMGGVDFIQGNLVQAVGSELGFDFHNAVL